MSQKEHRLGVAEVNLVVRHLKLEAASPEKISAIIAEIDTLYGLDSISYDAPSQVLNLAYDATRLNIDGLEKLIHQHDVQISHDWWTRFKEGYYRFVDQNVKENKQHEPWSCHKK